MFVFSGRRVSQAIHCPAHIDGHTGGPGASLGPVERQTDGVGASAPRRSRGTLAIRTSDQQLGL
jgi:hypothetical protein